jgi:RNA-directed DNA polymerase
MPTDLARILAKAKAEPQLRFTSLYHHLYVDTVFLTETWLQMNHHGAAGVDRVSIRAYEEHLQENLRDLTARLARQGYRVPMVRRAYIPKPGQPDKKRPLGIPTVEDRLVQASVARLLSAIYEADFLECSYGFRPGRSAHHALAAIRHAIYEGWAQYVYEADIRGFFDHLDHAWLMRMLELRIGDPRILRLIRKWLRAGVLDGEQVLQPGEGTPQGGPISPLLANVYLHYALDLWFTKVIQPKLRGRAQLIRYADDFVVLFARREDAEAFGVLLQRRLAKFGLETAPEKTRVLPFGTRTWKAGGHRGVHFDFLGFRHHLGTSRRTGRMVLIRHPSPKSLHKFLTATKEWIRRHRDRLTPEEQQQALSRRLRGFYQYFALWHCVRKLTYVHREVLRAWRTQLRHRSQRSPQAWAYWRRQPWFCLPTPKLLHPTV